MSRHWVPFIPEQGTCFPDVHGGYEQSQHRESRPDFSVKPPSFLWGARLGVVLLSHVESGVEHEENAPHFPRAASSFCGPTGNEGDASSLAPGTVQCFCFCFFVLF